MKSSANRQSLEDIAFSNAMKKGSNSKRVSKKKIMAILESVKLL